VKRLIFESEFLLLSREDALVFFGIEFFIDILFDPLLIRRL